MLPVVWSTYVNANYMTAKMFMLFLASSLALFALPETFKLRRTPRLLTAIGFFLIGYQVIYYALDPTYFNLLYSAKTLSFLFLLLYFYSLDLSVEEFLRKNTLLIGAMFGFIAIVTFRQIWNLHAGGAEVVYGGVLSTFGNVNMFSEFVILCLPFLFLWQRSDDGIYRWLKLLFWVAFVFLLLFCSSRSAWMGLGLFLLAKVYFRMERKEWLATGLSFLLYFATFFVLSGEGIAESKQASSGERMLIYNSSVKLLADSPFGIEIGRYLSDVVPYLNLVSEKVKDSTYYDQPHSELLKWGIQFGWLYLLVALAGLACLTWYFSRRVLADKKSSETVFFEFLLVLAPQIVFQFPFENPASLLVIAFVTALFLSRFEVFKEINISKVKFVTAILATIGLFNAFFYISTVYLTSNYNRSSDIMRVMCKVYPTYFQSCYWKHVNNLESKRFDQFRLTYKSDFSRLPFHPDHLRVLVPYFNSAGERVKMCDAVKIYNHLYPGQQTVREDMVNFCQSQRDPFDFTQTSEFRENYLRWLNR